MHLTTTQPPLAAAGDVQVASSPGSCGFALCRPKAHAQEEGNNSTSTSTQPPEGDSQQGSGSQQQDAPPVGAEVFNHPFSARRRHYMVGIFALMAAFLFADQVKHAGHGDVSCATVSLFQLCRGEGVVALSMILCAECQ